MDMQKYENMAYGNSTGKKWLNTLYSDEMWSLWKKYLLDRTRITKVYDISTYPQRVVIEAIWHLGYTQDISNKRIASRCTRRLRRPPDRGAGVDQRGASAVSTDQGAYGIPYEFKLLDEFLEYYVRPLI